MAKFGRPKRVIRTTNAAREKGALDLIEEAIHLLRTAAFSVVACYYIGSLPFILGLLYFWTDMLSSAYAPRHCAEAAFGLTLLFLWMKSWQAVFADKLMASIRGIPAAKWLRRRIVHLVAAQTIFQAWGMIVLPAAILMVIPFGWAYAFFQNITVYGNGEQSASKIIRQHAWRQAMLWQKQNHLLIWLLSPWLLVAASLLVLVVKPALSAAGFQDIFGYFLVVFALLSLPLSPLGIAVALNIASGIAVIPQLLKTFFGIETIFTMSSYQLMNSTFLAVICSLTYLCLDPLVKAAYTLRCFYGEAVSTGEDLKIELRQFLPAGKTVLLTGVLLLMLFAASAVQARENPPANTQTTPVASAGKLDESISRVLSQPEYAWRLPRDSRVEQQKTQAEMTWLESIFDALAEWSKAVGRWIEKGLDWLDRVLFPRGSTPFGGGIESGGDSFTTAQILIFTLLAVIACLLAILAWRAWRKRAHHPVEIVAQAIAPLPDITDENINAAELPEDGWLKMASDLIEQGQLRLALRALHLAGLACLAHYELITIAKFKSDRDYERELQRRAHAAPNVLDTFKENRAIFERSWYGLHEVTLTILERVRGNYRAIHTMLSQEQVANPL